MNKKIKYILCGLTTVIVFILLTGAITAYNRHKFTSSLNENFQPAKGPAELAEDKIAAYYNPDALISVYRLQETLNDPNQQIIDLRGRSFQALTATYRIGHIPGATYILNSEYAHHAYPGRIGVPVAIQAMLGQKGVDNQKRLVVYSNDGAQARLYWMMKMYGCTNPISILDGGIEKWQTEGFEITAAAPAVTPARFLFNPALGNAQFYARIEDVIDAILNYTPEKIIVDARTANEYKIGGHIPGSVNVGADGMLNEDKTFKSAAELEKIFTDKGVTPEKTVFVYSNIGHRSSLIWFVLHELLGYRDVRNYEAGFSEWHFRERVKEFGEQKLKLEPATPGSGKK